MNSFINHFLRFVFLVLFQVFILNNINLGGYINPNIYILFILMLPFNTNRLLLILFGFICGFSIDILSGGIIGIHSASCVLIAYIRPNVISLISTQRSFETNSVPSVKDMGFKWFLTYIIILTIIHHLMYFYIEIFSFRDSIYTLIRIFISSFFTISLLIISQYIIYIPGKNKK